MTRIAIIMSVGSHQTATFGLAKKLLKKSHEVLYAGTEFGIYDENLAENARIQGFSYYILDPYVGAEPSNDFKKQFLTFATNLFEGVVFKKFVDETKVDVVLLDIHLPIYAIALFPFDIDVIFLSTELNTERNEYLPPLTSDFAPRTELDHVQVKLLWDANSQNNSLNPPLKMMVTEFAAMQGFPFDELYREKCIVLFGLDYPEILLWPREFEFPGTLPPKKYYVGCNLDLDRHEPHFAWPFPSSGRKLIYCAFGTVLNHDELLRFLDKLVVAMKSLDNFDFIVSVGRLFDKMSHITLPENVKLFKTVSQLVVLRRTDLMITLGGANSMKECITLGVPMLCYPFHNDQFGNCARLAYHNLGLTGNVHTDSSDDIRSKIEILTRDNSFRVNGAAFRDTIEKSQDVMDVTHYINHFRRHRQSVRAEFPTR